MTQRIKQTRLQPFIVMVLLFLICASTRCRKTYGTNCADSPETLNLLSESKFRVFCDRDCALAPARLKGTQVYTSDSSFCRAAIHAGVIENFTGGKATVEMLPGQDSYQGSTRNGIQSESSGAHQASFRFD